MKFGARPMSDFTMMSNFWTVEILGGSYVGFYNGKRLISKQLKFGESSVSDFTITGKSFENS
jgi:hypothetical protein